MRRTAFVLLFAAVLLLLCLAACGKGETEPRANGAREAPAAPQQTGDSTEIKDETKMEKTLRLRIDGVEVAVLWEENEAVTALKELAATDPLTVQMSMYGGFEQVGPLGTSLPRNDKQTTAQAGDIVLYSGNQIVVFYGSNSWAYTRLGKITDRSQAELTSLLGDKDVKITILYGGKDNE